MADQAYDVVMIGAGPSALAAAVYTTREDLKTVLIEKAVIGGLAAITDLVDNYPGFAQGVTGLKLAEDFQAQAERFGAKIELGEVTQIIDQGKTKKNYHNRWQFHCQSGIDCYRLGLQKNGCARRSRILRAWRALLCDLRRCVLPR